MSVKELQAALRRAEEVEKERVRRSILMWTEHREIKKALI
jgi:hypothetical protein